MKSFLSFFVSEEDNLNVPTPSGSSYLGTTQSSVSRLDSYLVVGVESALFFRLDTVAFSIYVWEGGGVH